MQAKAIRPVIQWQQDKATWPEVPRGYERHIVGLRKARLLAWLWGVEPVHVNHNMYVLDVPLGEFFDRQSLAAFQARRWLGEAPDREARRKYLTLIEEFGSPCLVPKQELVHALEELSASPLPSVVRRATHDYLDAFAAVVWLLLTELA